jgi:3-oxoacyl-[acyl-carrier-protein] synthase II
MGASSALESIFTMEGMLAERIPPTINYTEDPEIALDSIVTETQNCGQEYVLKNSFGFGGCNTCIVFRRLR